MRQDHPDRVEDYTAIALFFLWINMVWVFGVIWACFGIGWVILIGMGLNRAITALKDRREAQEARIVAHLNRRNR